MKNITYAIHKYDGYIVSRVGSDVAFPVLDYAAMNQSDGYQIHYRLEKMSVYSISNEWDCLKWTKKIPIEIKNKHREFWGMKPLKQVNRLAGYTIDDYYVIS